MSYQSYTPGPPLSDDVEYLWSLSDVPTHQRERIVPESSPLVLVRVRILGIVEALGNRAVGPPASEPGSGARTSERASAKRGLAPPSPLGGRGLGGWGWGAWSAKRGTAGIQSACYPARESRSVI